MIKDKEFQIYLFLSFVKALILEIFDVNLWIMLVLMGCSRL